jgi:hypothetical protein
MKPPSPKHVDDENAEERKDKTAPKDKTMISPGGFGVEISNLTDDSPREDVEDVGYQGLVKIPGRTSCEKDRGQLGRDGV